jgi:hypothetical protein
VSTRNDPNGGWRRNRGPCIIKIKAKRFAALGKEDRKVDTMQSYEFRSGFAREGRGYDPRETWDERQEYMTPEEIVADDEVRRASQDERFASDVEDSEDELVLTLANGDEVLVPLEWPSYNKTQKIRYLCGWGLTVNQIAKGLGYRYQQVYQAVNGSAPRAGVSRCTVCGRPLTRSAEAGIGPVCAGKHTAKAGDVIHFGEGDDEYYQGAKRVVDEDEYFQHHDARMRRKFGMDDR